MLSCILPSLLFWLNQVCSNTSKLTGPSKHERKSNLAECGWLRGITSTGFEERKGGEPDGTPPRISRLRSRGRTHVLLNGFLLRLRTTHAGTR